MGVGFWLSTRNVIANLERAAIMWKTILTGALLISSTAAFGRGEVVSQQEFTAKVSPRSIECYPGHDGNFPVNLRMSFSTSYGSANLYYPSTLLLQNTDRVRFSGSPSDSCSDYSEILGAGDLIPVSGTKTIYESVQYREDYDVCQRTLREELVIDVKGQTFSGAESLYVFRDESVNCRD